MNDMVYTRLPLEWYATSGLSNMLVWGYSLLHIHISSPKTHPFGRNLLLGGSILGFHDSLRGAEQTLSWIAAVFLGGERDLQQSQEEGSDWVNKFSKWCFGRFLKTTVRRY